MLDKLEQFVKGHRDAFDDEIPGERVWESIQKDISSGRPPKKKNHMIYWRAAAVFLFLVSAWLVFDKLGLDSRDREATVQESAELRDAESFYFTVINGKKKELIRMGRGEKNLERDFFSDLTVLDSAYNVLKTNMNMGNKGEIEDAMILNLQLRIEILNRQLDILNTLKDENIHENITL